MYESKTLAPDCCTCSQIVRLIDGRLNYLCIYVHIIMKQLKTSSPVSTWIDDTLSGAIHSLPALSLSLALSILHVQSSSPSSYFTRELTE